MSLASFTLAGVTPEQFEKLQEAFTTEFHGGGNHSDSGGTFIDHAATVDYKYDGESNLTLSIERVSRLLFKKVRVEEVESNLRDFITEVLGETPSDKQPEPEVTTEELEPVETEEVGTVAENSTSTETTSDSVPETETTSDSKVEKVRLP